MKYFNYSENTLDISNIVEGMIIKNYKEACKLLKEDEHTGESKKAQINRWKRYFDFYKEGQKIIITEIYNEPFPSDDARKRKEGLYVKYIELLLLDFLSRQNDFQVIINKKKLYEILGMTNSRYKLLRGNKNEIKEYIQDNYAEYVSTFDINHFYQRADQKLNDILYSALKSMKDRFLIDYKTINLIGIKQTNGEIINHISSNEEDKLILEAKNAVLTEMGYTNMTQVLLTFKANEFYSSLDSYVQKEYGWEYFYSQLYIIYIDNIAKQIPIKADEIRTLSKSDKMLQLNEEIIKSLDEQANKKFEKNQQEVMESVIKNYGRFDLTDDDKVFAYQNNYPEIQHALAEYLIKIQNNLLKASSIDDKDKKSKSDDDELLKMLDYLN